MTDLVAFLRARLDEDEAAAQWAIEQVGDGHWQQRHVRIVTMDDRDREVADYAIVECIDHIVRHDPARVLADVEAKRRIVEDYEIYAREYREAPSPFAEGRRFAALLAVSRVADAHADHPDYDPAWRP